MENRGGSGSRYQENHSFSGNNFCRAECGESANEVST